MFDLTRPELTPSELTPSELTPSELTPSELTPSELTRSDVTGPEGHAIDTDRGRLDVTRVHDWISTDAYWARGRSRELMEQAIEGSTCFGVYASDGQQVAFARIVTDSATFAWLCDVYVAREARGRGIGTWLVQVIREHLFGLGVRRIVLATADAHAVYAKAGFTPFASPERYMELDVRTRDLNGDVRHT